MNDSGDVWFVPALFGMGTPVWDFGARGAFFGITRGTGRAEMVRAVLEGIAHRGCDLIEAAEEDTGAAIPLSGSTEECLSTPPSCNASPTSRAVSRSCPGDRVHHPRCCLHGRYTTRDLARRERGGRSVETEARGGAGTEREWTSSYAGSMVRRTRQGPRGHS